MPPKSDLVLERLQKLHPKKIDLSLGRMTTLLKKLRNPERKLPPVIHVAGTNGKGSTVAYLRAILEAAGLRVHVYSSPHLVRFAERIRLAGKLIDEDQLLDSLLHCEQVNGDTPITYFEITTAIAFQAFAHCPADIVLLEVGLGGRLDATNVIDKPLSTVITPVSMDHEQFLGNDLGGIAHEKAGIAKSGVPLILANQSDPAKEAILDYAEKVGATTFNWTVEPTVRGFDYQDGEGNLSLPRPALRGPHQVENAGLAIACLRHQSRFEITAEDFAKGITCANWPARLQNITDSRYGKILPKGSELWLDGGHNPAAGQILADYFSEQNNTPLYLICGMMAGKDTSGFLIPLAVHVTKTFGIEVIGEDSHSAVYVATRAEQVGMMAQASPSVTSALQAISEDRPVRVLICGSLYLAGYILAQNELLPS
ncbi:MAG: bifunctional folylpolyglutamate synthase/dihydrofolate synthase [Emcibacter sp.]|nr:bifunctional folylpolyglutamate synthase/dihydrofolate synthase [Emcibacter sp.]